MSQSNPIIDFKPVKSSMVAAVAYSPETKTMHVKFPNGKHYAYLDVAPDQHAAFVGAESIGKHFGTFIRGQFKHRMIEEPRKEQR